MPRKSTHSKDINIMVGRLIQELRLMQGLSRVQIATKIGVTHQQLEKYEKATNRISFDRMCLISKALGKPLSYFNDDTGDVLSPNQRAAMEVSRNFMKITDPTDKHAASQLVKTLASKG